MTLRDRSLFMAGGEVGVKSGGGRRKYFDVQRVGIEKKVKPWVGIEKIPYQIFFLTTSITLSHVLKTCTIILLSNIFVSTLKSGHRKFLVRYRVGRENIFCKKSFDSDPPPPGHK